MWFCVLVTAARTDWEHGTSFGYQYAKCRCDGCRGWKRDYMRRLRKSPLALADDPSVSIPTFNAALVELAKRHRPELRQIIASMKGGDV